MSDETETQKVLKVVFDEVIKNLIVDELVTYDPETDSITVTEKGLTVLVGKEVIN